MRIPLACLLGVALAVPAIAQSGSVTQYPACPDPPPKLSPAELDAAHAAYKVGVEAYQTGDYQKALDNLKEAFRRDCSKVVLLDAIARSYEGLGNRAEAIHALETYLQRNPKAADAETVQNRIKNLKALMEQQGGTATASTTAPTATVQPTSTETATATVAPTSTAPPEETHGHTAGPWIVLGAGVAAAIAGGVMIGVGQSQYNTGASLYETNKVGCGMMPTSPMCVMIQSTVTSDEQNGQLLRGIGIAVGAVGIVAVVSGLIWHFVEPTGAKKASLTPVVGPGYAGLSLGGAF